MKFLTKEVKIGAMGIVALFLLVYGINYLKGIDIFRPSKYIYVNFSDINGLVKSSPVFANGYQLGLVSDIEYNYKSPGHVVVEVELDEDAMIPVGSHAELVTDMLGGFKLNLILNKETQQYYSIGDTINGKVDYGMMKSFSKLMPKVESILPKIDTLLTSLNRVIANSKLDNSLVALNSTVHNLNSSSYQLKKLMGNDIPQLTGKLNKLSDNFISISDNLREVDYASTFSKIDSTMSDLRKVTTKLNRKDNSIGLLLNSRSLYDNLETTTVNASTLLKDLKENPKRYVHFSIFGRKNKK